MFLGKIPCPLSDLPFTGLDPGRKRTDTLDSTQRVGETRTKDDESRRPSKLTITYRLPEDVPGGVSPVGVDLSKEEDIDLNPHNEVLGVRPLLGSPSASGRGDGDSIRFSPPERPTLT